MSMCVLMMPDYRADNSYQQLLADGVSAEEVDVVFPSGYRRVFPITRTLWGSDADAVHMHWVDPYFKGTNSMTRAVYAVKCVIDLLLVSQLADCLVWTVHNVESHDAEYPHIELWLRGCVARIVDALIVHDESTRGRVASAYEADPDDIHVVPHGHYRDVYDAPPPRSEARQELCLPAEERVFLYFGMLKPYKGVEDLLDVWSAYHADHPEDWLLVAGKPENERYGQKLVQQVDRMSSVTFHGRFIPDREVPIYFGAADVAVFPFRDITTSGSVILALSFGVPVLAPRIGEIGNVVGDADHLLYEHPASENLVHALQRSKKTDLQKLARVTRTVCDGRSWDIIGQATSEVYVEAGGGGYPVRLSVA